LKQVNILVQGTLCSGIESIVVGELTTYLKAENAHHPVHSLRPIPSQATRESETVIIIKLGNLANPKRMVSLQENGIKKVVTVAKKGLAQPKNAVSTPAFHIPSQTSTQP
jgi:hypothetical protein